MNENKKIIGYIRVSTDHKEQKTSIENQKKMLQQKYGLNVEIVADTGSGLKLKTRPNFVKMLTEKCGLKIIHGTDKSIFIDIDNDRKSTVDLIVVKSISRFSRNSESIAIINKLSEKGVYVFFEDIGKSTEGQDNALIINLLLSIAQQESLNTSQRIKQAFKTSANENRLLGNPIYGYEYIRTTNSLKIIEEEAKVVRLVFNKCINGKGARVIAKELKEMNIRNKKGNYFSSSSIKNMLKNIKYTGTNFRGKFSNINITSENARVVINENIMYQKSDRIEPIIDMKIFDKAKKALSSRVTNENGSSTGKNYIKDKYREKTICGCCGGKIYVSYSTKNYPNVGKVRYAYLVCNDKKINGKNYCNNKNLNLDKFEKVIDEQFNLYNEYLEMYNHIKYAKFEMDLNNVINSNTDDLVKENDNIKLNIEQLKNQTNNVIDGLVNATSETVKNMMNDKINTLSIQIQEFENKLNTNIEIIYNGNFKIQEIKKEMKVIEEQIKNPQKLTKDEFINVIDKIEIVNKEVNVLY